MADGMAPDTSAADAGQRREADLQATIDALNAANPHDEVMGLPGALCDDGGM